MTGRKLHSLLVVELMFKSRSTDPTSCAVSVSLVPSPLLYGSRLVASKDAPRLGQDKNCTEID